VGLVAVPLLPGKDAFGGAKIDRRLADSLLQLKKRAKLKGKDGERAVAHTTSKVHERIGLVGAGKPPFEPALARKLAAQAVRLATAEKASSVAVVLEAFGQDDLADVVAAAAEGAELAGYGKPPSTVSLVIAKDADVTVARAALKIGAATSGAAIFARDLVNEPASEMTPARLVEAAKEVAVDGIELKVMDRKELTKMGAGGILAVAKGSDEPPYMVHLTYKPEGEAKAKICVVGKGLTFDSGGLSLKPSNAMEDMKIDMAGSAAMLGLFRALPQIAPDVEVHGIAALCENMPSGRAVKPGDVVKTMNGQTIEVLNTDAEGRVTLADTLHYGAELKPDFMIDMATLTGACMVALGQEVAGLFSNSDELSERLAEASERAGEMIWRMPMPKEYNELVKSQIADLRNTSTVRYGGAITASMFLQHFVGNVPWAHLDIAGPAWAEKDTVPYQPKGATGFGARTVLKFLRSF